MRGDRIFFRGLYKAKFWVKKSPYTIQERFFFYVIYFTIATCSISLVTNAILGLSAIIQWITLGGIAIMLFLFWLGHVKKQIIIAQYLLLAFTLSVFNALWFLTEGSTGVSLLILYAFIPLFLFFGKTKYIPYVVAVFFTNIISLFIIELNFPDLISPYPSKLAQTFDIMSISIIFFFFEIPLIMYVRKALVKETKEAKNSEQQRTSFIASLSHEIRTPMNAILGFSELLEDESLEQEMRKEYVDIINRNGRSLLNLLNNIISFTRLDSNTIEPNRSTFKPQDVIHQVYEMFYKQVEAKGNVKFIVDIPKEDIEMCSDALMIYQILTNLTYNSIKFTTEGFIKIGYNVINNNITFFVKDTGIGISKLAQSNIFKQYTQDDNATLKNNPNGAGLGLTICKKTTYLLNGKIWVESELGQGANFYISFPRTKEYTQIAKRAS